MKPLLVSTVTAVALLSAFVNGKNDYHRNGPHSYRIGHSCTIVAHMLVLACPKNMTWESFNCDEVIAQWWWYREPNSIFIAFLHVSDLRTRDHHYFMQSCL